MIENLPPPRGVSFLAYLGLKRREEGKKKKKKEKRKEGEKKSVVLSFFLGWQIPNFISELSVWWALDELLRTQETVPDSCRPSLRPICKGA